MPSICEADVKAVLGETDSLVVGELVRTKATAEEFAQAVEFVRCGVSADLKSYQNLESRTQRLIDLLSVTGIADTDALSHAA